MATKEQRLTRTSPAETEARMAAIRVKAKAFNTANGYPELSDDEADKLAVELEKTVRTQCGSAGPTKTQNCY
jgi:hypothetical protein